MKNSPEEIKNYLMWMVGNPSELTQEWIFTALQQFMEGRDMTMEEIQALVPVITDQDVIQGHSAPEDPMAQAFLDCLVEYLKEQKLSGEY